jgi:hypothetical protein
VFSHAYRQTDRRTAERIGAFFFVQLLVANSPNKCFKLPCFTHSSTCARFFCCESLMIKSTISICAPRLVCKSVTKAARVGVWKENLGCAVSGGKCCFQRDETAFICVRSHLQRKCIFSDSVRKCRRRNLAALM